MQRMPWQGKNCQLMGVDGPLTASKCQKMVVVKDHQQREPSIGNITTIGLDLAKNVFQIHAVDQAGSVLMRKRLRRGQVLAFDSVVSRRARSLCDGASLGARVDFAWHEPRLMPPTYVKAHVKRNEHDVVDAEAICEARFVPIKTVEQQSALLMHSGAHVDALEATLFADLVKIDHPTI
jgi:transposase